MTPSQFKLFKNKDDFLKYFNFMKNNNFLPSKLSEIDSFNKISDKNDLNYYVQELFLTIINDNHTLNKEIIYKSFCQENKKRLNQICKEINDNLLNCKELNDNQKEKIIEKNNLAILNYVKKINDETIKKIILNYQNYTEKFIESTIHDIINFLQKNNKTNDFNKTNKNNTIKIKLNNEQLESAKKMLLFYKNDFIQENENAFSTIALNEKVGTIYLIKNEGILIKINKSCVKQDNMILAIKYFFESIKKIFDTDVKKTDLSNWFI